MRKMRTANKFWLVACWLAPDTEARRRRGVRLGIQNLAAKAEDKEQLFDAKRFASAARDSLLDVRGVVGPPARGEGL